MSLDPALGEAGDRLRIFPPKGLPEDVVDTFVLVHEGEGGAIGRPLHVESVRRKDQTRHRLTPRGRNDVPNSTSPSLRFLKGWASNALSVRREARCAEPRVVVRMGDQPRLAARGRNRPELAGGAELEHQGGLPVGLRDSERDFAGSVGQTS